MNYKQALEYLSNFGFTESKLKEFATQVLTENRLEISEENIQRSIIEGAELYLFKISNKQIKS